MTDGWELTDRALQLRGGRGYETERSLSARGEPAIGIERMLRDSRINRIFEGPSEIMHLFIAREAVDKHLEVAGVLIDPERSVAQKLRSLPRIALFYALWYPKLWFGWGLWPRYRGFGALAPHLRYAERTSRRLARSVFHGMLRFGPKLERKQAFLFRAVDVALELFALSASVLCAQRRLGSERGERELVARFFHGARQRSEAALRAMWRNDDAARYAFAQQVLEGRYQWLERGVMALPYEVEDLRPRTMDEFFAERRRGQSGDRRSGAERELHAE